MGRVDGLTAIVTGAAARGIGRACVEALAREGAAVLATDIDAAGVDALAERLRGEGLEVTAAAHDVGVPDDWARVVDEAVGRYRALGALVNNAGIVIPKPFEDHGLDDFRRTAAVNYRGPFLGMKHAIPALRRNGGGAIVNVSSIAGQRAVPGYAAYCASKGGVKLMTKALALECGAARDGIRINSIHPGPIWTSMIDNLGGPDADAAAGEAMRARLAASLPLGRMGTPEDVAALVLFLVSSESAYATGAEFTIDGGMTA